MMSAMKTPAGWGPSHQTAKSSHRGFLPGWVVVAIFADLGLWTALGQTTLMWFLVFVPVLIVVFVIWRVAKRMPKSVNAWAAGQITRAEDPLKIVRAVAVSEGSGVYLGATDKDDWRHARPERAVLLLGPPRSGKTSGVIIPGLLSHTGPAVCTSTKPDVARATRRARSRFGRVWLFDPTGSSGSAGGEELRWSPVTASVSWDGALLMARAMTAAAGVGTGTTHGSHWAKRSQALLAPFLHAAALDGRDMESVLDWVMRHQLDEAGILLEQERASRLAFGSLIGLLNTEDRERASIFSAAADALQAYISEAALDAAKDPNFQAEAFVASEDTIYIHAPAEEQAGAAPIVCGLLAEIRRATYHAHQHGSLRGRVLFALDEVANIAPLEELPQIASEGGGQGLDLLAALQDLSQARARWGNAADGFLTLFGTKVILPGIADTRTLEAISTALGEYDRQTVATSRASSGIGAILAPQQPAGPLSTRTVSTQRTRVLSPGEIANIPAGHALHLNGLTWELLAVTPAHSTEPWKTLTAPPAG
jgi:type IV secretory pathway TraG/TraD family ATPase VirD4